MKFVVVTYGTEGDTRPMGVLCRALMDAGHGVHLLAAAGTLGSAEALGVPTTALAGDMQGALRQETDTIHKGGGFGDTARILSAIANANAEAWLRATVAAGEGCDAVILSGLAAFIGLSAAEFLDVPGIGAALFPLTPTREFASPFLRPGTLPRWLNRASQRLVGNALWWAFRSAVNEARAAVCRLPPRRRLWTEHPLLYGISPSLVPQPADWPENARICGQWLLPATDWSPPAALAEFLAAGEPPVYLGFGSMSGFGRGRIMREAIDALRGRRVVLTPGWSDIAAADLPPNVHLLEAAPHGWLFPRMALVVHHGGAGTTHAAARAGVPSVVVPFAADQFFWADRLRRVGAAPAPVPAQGLTSDRLAQAIREADGSAPRAGAASLGASIAREDGLGTAVAAIEKLAAID